MDEIALAGGGSVKVFGKGTLDDYMKAAKANFSKGSKLGNKLDEFARGKLSFDDVLGDYAKKYSETVAKNGPGISLFQGERIYQLSKRD